MKVCRLAGKLAGIIIRIRKRIIIIIRRRNDRKQYPAGCHLQANKKKKKR